eukprot:gene10586-12317_t
MNRNATIWIEFPGNKTITTSYSVFENVTRVCQGGDTTCEEGLAVNTTEWVLHEITRTVPVVLPPKRICKEVTDSFNNLFLVSVNAFTVVLKVDGGVITDALWDGDRDPSICSRCSYCVDGQCAMKYEKMNCDKIENVTVTQQVAGVPTPVTIYPGCSLKIYVAWQGTDKMKSNCISIAKIPSALSRYSTAELSQIGLGLFQDIVGKIVGNTNNPNTA